MNKKSLSAQIRKKTPLEISIKRDCFPCGSEEWEYFQQKKVALLEKMDAKYAENVVFFYSDSEEAARIPKGFSHEKRINSLKCYIDKRSFIEFTPEYLQPVVCILLNYQGMYYFRYVDANDPLKGLGLIEGYVTEDCVNILSVNKTILNGLKKAIAEDAGIGDCMVSNIQFLGTLKDDELREPGRLAILYEVTLVKKGTKMSGYEKPIGEWLSMETLKQNLSRLEPWAKELCANVFFALS